MQLEEVLSLDLEDDSLLYRVRRGRRVLYVDVQAPGLIPKSDRTESGAILKHLRQLKQWTADWQTLTVQARDGEYICEVDKFRPHCLRSDDLDEGLPRYDLADMIVDTRISDRLFTTSKQGQVMVIKVARFDHEIRYLRRELEAYRGLHARGFASMPRILAYVFEEHHDRVVAFAMEYLEGRHVGTEDLEACTETLSAIHSCGYIFGDLNRHNWIRTAQGVKVIDLETSLPKELSTISPPEELLALPGHLADESGVGRR